MKRKLCKLFCICAIAFSMMGCGASDKIEVPDFIRGDAPVHNNELIQIGMIQTGKESDHFLLLINLYRRLNKWLRHMPRRMLIWHNYR